MRLGRIVALNQIRAAAAAFQFLSRLPLPLHMEYTVDVFRRSTVYYPVVGAVIGVLLSSAAWIFGQLLPPLPAAAVLLAVWVALTGGLHLDGLMDTADGILSHRPREQMLEIMKDSRSGAMGVMVCVLYLVMKLSLLSALLSARGTPFLWLLPLVPAWSRWWMTAGMACWPYARANGGLGGFFRGVGARHVAAGAAIALALTLAAAAWSSRGWTSGPGHAAAIFLPLALPAAAAGSGCLVAVYCSSKLGGLTGDVYGAMNEAVELALLLVLALAWT